MNYIYYNSRRAASSTCPDIQPRRMSSLRRIAMSPCRIFDRRQRRLFPRRGTRVEGWLNGASWFHFHRSVIMEGGGEIPPRLDHNAVPREEERGGRYHGSIQGGGEDDPISVFTCKQPHMLWRAVIVGSGRGRSARALSGC